MLRYVAVFALVAATLAQDFDYDPAPRPAPPRLKAAYSGGGSKSPPPPPVAIIKQIDRHNEDGSYTYGYESADGSFKIETKLPTGEVKGKYGYVDDVGKVRVIEYGATKYGFAPAGEGITVPPPTIVDETTDKTGALLPEYSGAYDQPDDEPEPIRSQPAFRSSQSGSNFEFSSLPASRPAPRPALKPAPRPAPLEYSPPQTFEPAPEPAPARQAAPRPAPSSYSFDFPSRPAPAPSRPAFTPAAAPPRPSFSNAAPLEDFGGIPSRPAPKHTFAPLPSRPAPQPSFAPAPAPQYRPAPKPAGRAGGGSILDQLSKDYALPQGESSPLHDISFGYF